MDRLLHIAASGSNEIMLAQAVNSHNLANVSTPGFRADLLSAQSRYLSGSGYASRVYATEVQTGSDFSIGRIDATGRDLDVAVNGEGWIAVAAADGSEALSRRGDLRVDDFGRLTNGAGLEVLGEDGPIVIPPFDSLTIGADGTLSIIPQGERPAQVVTVDRIKLVNPPAGLLRKSPDGLVRIAAGEDLQPDAAVRLSTGALESSNVNAVGSMVKMIELARQFEMHTRMMLTARDLDASASSLIRLE